MSSHAFFLGNRVMTFLKGFHGEFCLRITSKVKHVFGGDFNSLLELGNSRLFLPAYANQIEASLQTTFLILSQNTDTALNSVNKWFTLSKIKA